MAGRSTARDGTPKEAVLSTTAGEVSTGGMTEGSDEAHSEPAVVESAGAFVDK